MAEQRYTPVPGMGRPATHEMSQVGGSRSSGYGDENYFYEEGAVPAAHRFSYTDSPSRSASSSRLQPDAMQQTHHNPFSSNYDTPLAGGAALGAGAGAGLAAGAATTTSRGPQMSERGAAYQNIPSEQYWGDSNAATASSGYVDHAAKARRNRMWKIGGIIFAILAVIAIVVGVVVSQVTKKSSNDSGSSSGSSSGNGTEADIGSDPSKFDKDSRLHQSFWAMAYTPQGAILPNCATNQANVTKDIQLLSQLTTRLRLYGANCDATAVVLQAIQDTKVDMTIWPAIYIDSNTQAYTDQVAAIKDAIEKYGTDHIEGIIVGNEYILNMAGTDSTTSSAYLSAAQDIMDHIQEVNTTIKGMSLNKHLPIGTSDAGSVLSTTLATGIDFFMANVHPWFATQPVSTAADWTYNFFHEFDVDVAATAPNNPACYIAETGWPTGTSNATEGNNGAASPGGDASLANLQTFMDTFVCQANANGTEYFYFEAFDEPWKEIYGGVEPHWGLFDSDRNLKDVTIPTCS